MEPGVAVTIWMPNEVILGIDSSIGWQMKSGVIAAAVHQFGNGWVEARPYFAADEVTLLECDLKIAEVMQKQLDKRGQ